MKELSTLISAIRESIRTEAAKHPVFKKANGCIRIIMTPCTEDADAWLGGLSTFEKRANAGFGCVVTQQADIMTYEYTSAIVPGQDYGTFFEYPSPMSQTISMTVVEHEGQCVLDFLFIQVCVSGARKVDEDIMLANCAKEAISGWFEEPFEAVPTTV